ncbi:filamentous hemagglutinin N-terminal domain-containing protein, partial [Sphaerotilus mobilis]
MNRIHRVVRNRATGLRVAVQETARAQGPGSATVGRSLLPLVTALLLAGVSGQGPARAAPQGATVRAGTVDIHTRGQQTTVRNTPGAVIDWASFNIGANEAVRFEQRNAASAVLNRVTGSGGSEILGLLQSNGRVFVINGNGILIGAQARVDTAGFVASTLNLSDADFAAGRLRFEQAGSGAAGVIQQGQIVGTRGSTVALLGGAVTQGGTVQVDGGQVVLAAGQRITLTDLERPEISHIVAAPAHSVVNLGQLLAAGGSVQVGAGAVRHDGLIRVDRLPGAEGLGRDAQGRIVLEAIGGEVQLDGSVQANAIDARGGDIVVAGQSIHIGPTARIEAVGLNGGGQVRIGADLKGSALQINARQVDPAARTVVASGARIDVSASDQGDGGRLIIWGDDARVAGDLRARGGAVSGHGGFIETSGHHIDVDGVAISARATNGRAGEWLLDPYDLTISTAATSNNSGGVADADNVSTFSPTANASVVRNTDINAVLDAGTSVTLTTAGAGTQAGNLRQEAGADITLSASTSATLHLIADGTLTLNGNITSSGSGVLDVRLDSGGAMTVNGNLSPRGDVTLSAGSAGITLTTAGNIVTDGHVSLLTSGHVNLAASTTYTEGSAGDIDTRSGSGGITIGSADGGSVASLTLGRATSLATGAGAVTIRTAGGLRSEYSTIRTTSGDISVTSADGGILGIGTTFGTVSGGITVDSTVAAGSSVAAIGASNLRLTATDTARDITLRATHNGGAIAVPVLGVSTNRDLRVDLAGSGNINVNVGGSGALAAGGSLIGGGPDASFRLLNTGTGNISVTADASGMTLPSADAYGIRIGGLDSRPSGFETLSGSISLNTINNASATFKGVSLQAGTVVSTVGGALTIDAGQSAIELLSATLDSATGTTTVGGSGTTTVGNATITSAATAIRGGEVNLTGTLTSTGGLTVTAVNVADVASTAQVSSSAGAVAINGATVTSAGQVSSTAGDVTVAGTTATTVTGGSLSSAAGTTTVGGSGT